MTAPVADTVLEITRVFDAPPARVFAAWLDREQFQAWIGPEGVACEVQLLEPQVGGRYRLVMNTPEREIPVSGVFRLIEPPRRLVFTWSSPSTQFRDSIVTVTFQPSTNHSTVVEIRQVGLPDEEATASHHAGWTDILRQLARTHTETGAES